jgi:hypothetical protein
VDTAESNTEDIQDIPQSNTKWIPLNQRDEVLVGHFQPPGTHVQKLSTTGVLLPVPGPPSSPTPSDPSDSPRIHTAHTRNKSGHRQDGSSRQAADRTRREDRRQTSTVGRRSLLLGAGARDRSARHSLAARAPYSCRVMHGQAQHTLSRTSPSRRTGRPG